MASLNRIRFQRLAIARLKDAQVLLRARRPSAAYYLAGYSVECGLKACISKQTKRFEFPDKNRVRDSYSHKINDLAQLAGLDPSVESRTNPHFQLYWSIVADWTEESRYDVVPDTDARDLVRAITDPAHGVFRWLRAHW